MWYEHPLNHYNLSKNYRQAFGRSGLRRPRWGGSSSHPACVACGGVRRRGRQSVKRRTRVPKYHGSSERIVLSTIYIDRLWIASRLGALIYGMAIAALFNVQRSTVDVRPKNVQAPDLSSAPQTCVALNTMAPTKVRPIKHGRDSGTPVALSWAQAIMSCSVVLRAIIIMSQARMPMAPQRREPMKGRCCAEVRSVTQDGMNA